MRLRCRVFMLKNCAASCGLCRHVCQDHNESCSAWSKDGQCADNEAFMKLSCPASCGVCQSLESNRLKSSKEEL